MFNTYKGIYISNQLLKIKIYFMLNIFFLIKINHLTILNCYTMYSISNNNIYIFFLKNSQNNFKKLSIIYIHAFLLNFDFITFFKKIFSINNHFFQINDLKNIYIFNTVVQRFYNFGELDTFEVFFLRKNRVFNKGRYSRNRQNYRTGVYICFYLSILSIFGLYYTFYKFSFNFSYLWFGFYLFISSYFFNKVLKYNLLTYNSIKISFTRIIN